MRIFGRSKPPRAPSIGAKVSKRQRAHGRELTGQVQPNRSRGRSRHTPQPGQRYKSDWQVDEETARQPGVPVRTPPTSGPAATAAAPAAPKPRWRERAYDHPCGSHSPARATTAA
jgi:hypothetical protein